MSHPSNSIKILPTIGGGDKTSVITSAGAYRLLYLRFDATSTSLSDRATAFEGIDNGLYRLK